MEAGPITPEMKKCILRQVDPELREMFEWQLSHMEFVDGELVVHRDMKVPPEWIMGAEPGMPIGSFWSWAAGDLSPYLYPGNCPVRFIMTALVDPGIIDWNHVAGVQRHGISVIQLEEGTPLKVVGTKTEIAPLPDWDTWSPRFDPIPDDLPNWVGHTFAAGHRTEPVTVPPPVPQAL